jgi:hypothetical protein
MSAINPAGSSASSGAPTLLGFLQNLVSDLGGSAAASGRTTGALVNTTA